MSRSSVPEHHSPRQSNLHTRSAFLVMLVLPLLRGAILVWPSRISAADVMLAQEPRPATPPAVKRGGHAEPPHVTRRPL
jgi:hypothetical protein